MDIAAAHLAATEHLLAGGGTTVVNLGTGEGASVAAVIAAVERVTGRPLFRHRGAAVTPLNSSQTRRWRRSCSAGAPYRHSKLRLGMPGDGIRHVSALTDPR
jgi:nucleoside-diphosphate-sugar epimerase